MAGGGPGVGAAGSPSNDRSGGGAGGCRWAGAAGWVGARAAGARAVLLVRGSLPGPASAADDLGRFARRLVTGGGPAAGRGEVSVRLRGPVRV